MQAYLLDVLVAQLQLLHILAVLFGVEFPDELGCELLGHVCNQHIMLGELCEWKEPPSHQEGLCCKVVVV